MDTDTEDVAKNIYDDKNQEGQTRVDRTARDKSVRTGEIRPDDMDSDPGR